MSFLKTHLDPTRHATPQTQPLGYFNGIDYTQRQVPNAAGGYVFEIDPWAALDRFLIIGTMGGTYYASEAKITDENLARVATLLDQDGPRVVQRVVEISQAARAQKQDYGLAVLAMAASYKSQIVRDALAKGSCEVHGDSPSAIAYRNEERTRRAAYAAIPQVCRTASTLFQFLSYLKGRRKISSRGLRSAIAEWYNGRAVDQIAYQMVKYPQRHGYTHRDVLRLSHPDPTAPYADPSGSEMFVRQALYRWGVGKINDENFSEFEKLMPQIVLDARKAQRAAGKATAEERGQDQIALAKRLPREALPTEWLNDPNVWEALLYGEPGKGGMPLTALIRNLGNLTKHGVLAAGSDAEKYVVGELLNQTRLAKARIHPISLFIALKTYGSGRGFKGSGTWGPVNSVLDALGAAFYLAMGNVAPTGKRLVLGLDVSGSMGSHYGGAVNGIPNCAPREVVAAMALVHVRTEPIAPLVLPFDTRPYEFEVSKDEKLDRLIHRLAQYGGGGTNCEIPIGAAALPNVTPVAPDAVVIYTDNETWAGRRHVSEALVDARARNPHLKIVCAATTATNQQIADPKDPLTFGVCGFDAAAPTLINEFIGGAL